MQTDSIAETRTVWPRWADFLRRYGLEDMAAWMLEAGGPLTLLGAQALYLGVPFLRPVFAETQREALSSLLEDRDEALAFAAFLREEISL